MLPTLTVLWTSEFSSWASPLSGLKSCLATEAARLPNEDLPNVSVPRRSPGRSHQHGLPLAAVGLSSPRQTSPCPKIKST